MDNSTGKALIPPKTEEKKMNKLELNQIKTAEITSN